MIRHTASIQTRLAYFFGSALVLAGTVACNKQDASPGPETAASMPASAPASASPARVATAPAPPPAPIVVKDVGFKTPESVLHDADQDLYFVSNINGSPLEADGNGFISKVSPDGKVIKLKFIDGAAKGINLNAPKGMTISGDTLYVADLTFVRMFDRKTGAAKGKIGVAGATFLNDLATGPDGTVYVSDSGLKAGKSGFAPTGSDSVDTVSAKALASKTVITSKTLNRPNGLLPDADGVWMVAFGSKDLVHVSRDGKLGKPIVLPAGSLDGIVKANDGTLLIASWDASAIFRGTAEKGFTPAISGVEAPADIGYDAKRNRVLIPLFKSDAVQITPLGAAPAATAAAPKVAAKPAAPAKVAAKPAAKVPAKTATKPAAKAPAKTATKPAAKAPAKTAAKPAAKAPPKQIAASAPKPPPAAVSAPAPKK